MALVDGLPLGIPGTIHQGFTESLNNLWEAPGGLASHLERMAWAHNEGRPLLVTGHSKGGALALLAAMKLANLGAAELTPTAVVSFGAPRAGNASFAAAYQAVMGDRTWRFEYRDDLVPHLPPPGTLWKTLGRTLLRGQESVSRQSQPQEEDYEDYVAAGQLQFIDWAGRLRLENTGALHAERWLHLLHILTQRPSTLIYDHLPMSGCG